MKIVYDSQVGPLMIVEEDEHIVEITFARDGTRLMDAKSKINAERIRTASEQSASSVAKACVKELDAYFAGTLRCFSVPIKAHGTPFRMRVWEALKTIPYGETISYKELAEAINQPKAVRAVGGANHNNPISIIIPCHRVIGASGKLTGYGGGLENKALLLELERKYK